MLRFYQHPHQKITSEMDTHPATLGHGTVPILGARKARLMWTESRLHSDSPDHMPSVPSLPTSASREGCVCVVVQDRISLVVLAVLG